MPSDGPSDLCALALVPHDEVGEKAWVGHLSRREADHFAGLVNLRVRRRWLAGRLAGKHLLLRGPGRGPRLEVLDGERLRELPLASYREIELLPAPASGPPRLVWRGRELSPRVTLSHGGGFSCAALTRPGAAAGIDLETVAPRIPAFYPGNFTPRERQWADAGARSSGLPAPWLYTLLWTLKEAALKSGATPVRSVWGFAGMEIELPAALPERLAASRGEALGERFAGFEALVRSARRETRARVETTTTPETILSLLTASEANP